MGNELRCRARAGARKRGEPGKALLETTELIFRGDSGLRLRLRFAELTRVEARGGLLELHGPDGPVTLELPEEAAAKWAEKIKNPRGRIDKLGVKAGMQVSLVGDVDAIDGELRAELAARGADARFGKPRAPSDLIFFVAEAREELSRLAELARALAPAGGIWVLRRKGSPAISERDVLAAGKAAGLVDVKVVAFSQTHTAEKLVIPVAKRKKG